MFVAHILSPSCTSLWFCTIPQDISKALPSYVHFQSYTKLGEAFYGSRSTKMQHRHFRSTLVCNTQLERWMLKNTHLKKNVSKSSYTETLMGQHCHSIVFITWRNKHVFVQEQVMLTLSLTVQWPQNPNSNSDKQLFIF